jgi:hypothetical protein
MPTFFRGAGAAVSAFSVSVLQHPLVFFRGSCITSMPASRLATRIIQRSSPTPLPRNGLESMVQGACLVQGSKDVDGLLKV